MQWIKKRKLASLDYILSKSDSRLLLFNYRGAPVVIIFAHIYISFVLLIYGVDFVASHFSCKFLLVQKNCGKAPNEPRNYVQSSWIMWSFPWLLILLFSTRSVESAIRKAGKSKMKIMYLLYVVPT